MAAHSTSRVRDAVLHPQLAQLRAKHVCHAHSLFAAHCCSKCCVVCCTPAAHPASSTMKDITIQPDALTRFRAAASEFARSAKSRASRLQDVSEDIAALRAKGASFRTISELLGRCG